MGIDKFTDRFRSENELARRAEESHELAVKIASSVFERFPDSKDPSGRPVTSTTEPVKTRKGQLITLDQTNHSGGPGLCYNLSAIVDDVSHAYAQIRPGDRRIIYWRDANTGEPGSGGEDREVLELLEFISENTH